MTKKEINEMLRKINFNFLREANELITDSVHLGKYWNVDDPYFLGEGYLMVELDNKRIPLDEFIIQNEDSDISLDNLTFYFQIKSDEGGYSDYVGMNLDELINILDGVKRFF